ncbi:hypothetical protein B0H10DRAFT_2223763 [Mycena sp. CBHHK59/15]|nr:hypothetical protein B0H10DRAFT_2223763 [Mycena sp. CBHHK59/15]
MTFEFGSISNARVPVGHTQVGSRCGGLRGRGVVGVWYSLDIFGCSHLIHAMAHREVLFPTHTAVMMKLVGITAYPEHDGSVLMIIFPKDERMIESPLCPAKGDRGEWSCAASGGCGCVVSEKLRTAASRSSAATRCRRSITSAVVLDALWPFNVNQMTHD